MKWFTFIGNAIVLLYCPARACLICDSVIPEQHLSLLRFKCKRAAVSQSV